MRFSLCAWKCCWILFGDKTRYHRTAKVFDVHPSCGVNFVLIWSNNMCVRTCVWVPHDGFGSKTCHYDDFRLFPFFCSSAWRWCVPVHFNPAAFIHNAQYFDFFFCLLFQIAFIQCIAEKCCSNLFCCTSIACRRADQRWTQARSGCSSLALCDFISLADASHLVHIYNSSVFMGLCACVRVGMCLCGASECGESWHTPATSERNWAKEEHEIGVREAAADRHWWACRQSSFGRWILYFSSVRLYVRNHSHRSFPQRIFILFGEKKKKQIVTEQSRCAVTANNPNRERESGRKIECCVTISVFLRKYWVFGSCFSYFQIVFFFGWYLFNQRQVEKKNSKKIYFFIEIQKRVWNKINMKYFVITVSLLLQTLIGITLGRVSTTSPSSLRIQQCREGCLQKVIPKCNNSLNPAQSAGRSDAS